MKGRTSKLVMKITLAIPIILCFVIILNLANDSIRIIYSNKAIYDSSTILIENIYKSQTIILSLIGIAISVWVGLNIYNALSKEELRMLLDQAENAAKITQRVYTEVLTSKFRISSNDATASYYASKLEEIDMLPDIILERLITIEDLYNYSYKLYSESSSTVYNTIGLKQTKIVIDTVNKYYKDKIINHEQYSFILGFLSVRLGDFSYFKAQYESIDNNDALACIANDIIQNYQNALYYFFKIRDISLCITPDSYTIAERQCVAFIANSIASAYLLFIPNIDASSLKKVILIEEVAINFSAEISPSIKAIFTRNLGVALEKSSYIDEAFKEYCTSYHLDCRNYKTAHCLGSWYIKQIFQLCPQISDITQIDNNYTNLLPLQIKSIVINLVKHSIYWYKIKSHNNNGIVDDILIKLYHCLYILTNNVQNLLKEEQLIRNYTYTI